MTCVEKLKLENRISQQYKHLLHLVNAPNVDPNTIVSLEKALEIDYEKLNKLSESISKSTFPAS